MKFLLKQRQLKRNNVIAMNERGITRILNVSRIQTIRRNGVIKCKNLVVYKSDMKYLSNLVNCKKKNVIAMG